jgi:hypothetical protein
MMPTSILTSYEEVKADIHDLRAYPDGTPSFKIDREHNLAVAVTTLILDVIVCMGFWGLIAIVFNLLRQRWQLLTWLGCAIGGIGSAVLRWSYVGDKTISDFVVLFIYIPVAVGTISLICLGANCCCRSSQQINSNALPR